MDRAIRQLVSRMPLADAVFSLWRWVADEEWLKSLFEAHRGRCHERQISFPILVQLIYDALTQYGGSASRVFRKAHEAGELPASPEAAYGKLRRLPLSLSMAFVAEGAERLRQLFPEAARRKPPASLAGYEVKILDGKVIKGVAKRLSPLRGTAGGMLGGRALVTLDFATGLVGPIHADADGHANDVRFVGDLLPTIQKEPGDKRLWMADSQFCDLVQIRHFTAALEDHYLVRYHKKVSFTRDCTRPKQRGKDSQGRTFETEWGWLGAENRVDRPYVRRICLRRSGEENIILVTDLLNEEEVPSIDLLALYLERWGIERVFQKVTEVFGLEGLIGGTPEATVFQFAFCLLLYNQIQVIRGYIAERQSLECETISLENLYVDVRRELTAWTVIIAPDATLQSTTALPLRRMRTRLRQLTKNAWSAVWIKAVNQKRRTKTPASTRTHNSVYRILQKHQQTPTIP